MRHKKAPKRTIAPDSKFSNLMVAKLVNQIMRRGKKTIAQKVVYGSFANLETLAREAKEDSNPLAIFETALKNVGPTVEVRARRVGGSNYQIPVEVRPDRRISLALRWIIGAARATKGKPMAEKLANEFWNAAHNTGSAIKKREDVYRMAQANRAFAHFAK